MVLYLRGELEGSGSDLVRQNNVTITVTARCEAECGKKRKLENSTERCEGPNAKDAKANDDRYGMETFESVQDCADQLCQRLGTSEGELNVILCFRKPGRILDFECNETAFEFGGDVVDCSQKQYTVLLNEDGQKNFKLVAIVDASRLEEGTVLSTMPKLLARSVKLCKRKNATIKSGGEECECNEGVSYSLGCSLSWYTRPKGCKFSKSKPGMITREKLLCARQAAKTTDLFLIGGNSFFLFGIV